MLWLGVFSCTAVIMIMYWRDDHYAPQASELWLYFAVLPVALSVLICSPLLLWKWWQKRQAAEMPQATTTADPQVPAQDAAHQMTWHRLNVYSAAVQSALGENQTLLQAIQDSNSPELDPELCNLQGNPMLSYRITDLALDGFETGDIAALRPDVIDSNAQDIDVVDVDVDLRASEQRILALLQQQLEQHLPSLQQIAAHLQRSAMFYQMPVAQEYRLHPAWHHPEHEEIIEAFEQQSATHSSQVLARLDQLNVIVVLAEYFLARWDEHNSTIYIQHFLQQLGIAEQQVQFQYHYLAKATGYTDWLACLEQIAQQHQQVSLLLVLDSEIDQARVDEKSHHARDYVASEFGSSCCMASAELEIEALEPQRVLHLSQQQRDIGNSLEQLRLSLSANPQSLEQLEAPHQALFAAQIQHEQRFVMLLNPSRDRALLKKQQLQFAQTSIEMQHMLFAVDSLGDSDDLAMLFGFMLALQFDAEIYAMVHSSQHPQHAVFSSPPSAHPQADKKQT